MKPIKILHLYPDRMNIYGDFGNIISLTNRMEWRKVSFEYHTSSIGNKLSLDYDLIFMGGGQDKGQIAVAKDLQTKSSVLHDHLMRDVPILTICGAYQLFGKYFITAEGNEIPGIGLFNVVTKATEYRMIGNIVISNDIFGEMVGFENHSGETELLHGASPLGRVIKGYGNTKTSNYEGVIEKNAIGTYLH
ncbi:glutamine amidotransferase, partial [Candidatus Saccharibacteria bacterium]|nr:glutamine amidotransferase [Candidatus Saccharibacteria bacterium]